jgi:hypothetical protein
VALQVITLEEMLAHSALAEIQALTDSEEDGSTLAPLEISALDLLESELGRRLTVDATPVTVRLSGSGLTLLPLPERLDSFTRVLSETLGDVTTSVETTVNGWLLQGLYPHSYHWRSPVTITGKWGLTCPDRVKGVLMDVIEAMAVRKGDPVSRRDELAPWGAVSDGSMRADRDLSADRKATLENLLRYDAKKRLHGFYRPSIIEAI